MDNESQTERQESIYELRQSTPNDCELMFRLQKLDGAELDHNDPTQIAEFEQYQYSFVPAEIQVIYIENQPIGRLRIVRGEEIYIGGMQILPEHRGRGIGTALLKNLIEESNKTTKPIRLEVFHSNLQALRLYEKVGFKVIAENDQQKIMVYQPQ